MQSFSVGAVLSTGWRVWKHNVFPFTLLAALIYMPSSVAHYFVAPEDVLYLLPMDFLLSTLLPAALTYGVVMELDGVRPSFRDCVARGFAQLLPALGVTLLSLLAIGAGLALLVVPGVILMLRWYVAVPVALLEKRGVMGSLRRSRELTEGRKGQLFVLFFVYWSTIFGLTFLTEDMFPKNVLALVNVGMGAMMGAFGAVLIAVSYSLLRRDKDGTTAPELATAYARFTER